MTRIVVLANSKRPEGQCVAGIDLATGQWVRIITRQGDGIPSFRCFFDGKFLALCDILQVDLTRPRRVAQFQKENQVLVNWNWKIIGHMPPSDLRPFVRDASPILHNHADRVAPTELEALPTDRWISLELIHPRKLSFGRNRFDDHRWIASFEDKAGVAYSLRVTDPIVAGRLEEGESICPDCLLTVSLTKPWTHDAKEKAPLCYKLAAAVITLA